MEDKDIRAQYPEYSGVLKPEFISRAMEAYSRYKGEMTAFHDKVKDNDRWYKCNYGKAFNAKTNETEPATAFIANAIFNRYADFIDNYPVPNILERTPDDSECAKKLRDIIPLLLELTEFKKKYKRNCYNKMKNGPGIYGVFYNEEAKEIDIEIVDVLDFFCDIHVDDLQQSQFVFVRNAVDNELLCEMYPRYSVLFQGNASVEGRGETYQADHRTEIVDCYYKKVDGTLHMMKLVNDSVVLDATEDMEGYEDGLYHHGLYPFVIDVMYPDDDNIMGFSLIDICRNPQMYIDKLDGAILKNALRASRPKWLTKDSANININDLTDMEKEVVTSSTDVSETNVRMFQFESLPAYVREHREQKINELKEIAGNRDWNNGGTAQGVTAASAIEALQSTGQKLSRANIDDTYDSYKNIVYMVVELVRQFFEDEEVYRITDENGRKDFIQFSNAEMYRPETDVFGFAIDGEFKEAKFDIKVIPQKENPFTRETNNQTILSLWTSGLFMPQNMELAVMALQCMHFDTRDTLVELMQEYLEKQSQMQAQNMGAEDMMQSQMPQSDPLVAIPLNASEGGVF